MQVRTLDLYLEQMEQKMEDHENGTEGENPSVSMYRSGPEVYFWQSSSCKKREGIYDDKSDI